MMAVPVPPLSFGALLKRYRRLARLTQEQLAGRAGFGPSFISMLERSERMPVMATIELLAAALELSAAERDTLFAAQQRAIAAAIARDEQDERAERASAARNQTANERAGEPDDQTLPVGGFLGAAPDGRLVARSEEMRQLLAALDALRNAPLAHAGRLVMLAGEPGIGKTRLAQELALHARAQGVLVATGRCYERQQTSGFAPISEALGVLMAGAPGELRREAASRWPDLLARLPDAPLPAAGAGRSLAASDPGEQGRLFREVTDFVATVAARRPVALLLDDLHWADSASLDLLRHLARHTRGMRVLLLGTYREQEVRRQPELRTVLLDLVHERLVERISVRPMAPDEVAPLLAGVLATGELDAELSAHVYATTQGNPFFAQEVIRTLLERGEIALVDGRWQERASGPTGELALPETVRATLTERVARLSPLTQTVLRAASVLGPVFTLEPLAGMSERPLEDVEAALQEAQAAGLVHEAEGLEYGFSHALTQRAIYGDIPALRRRHLHRAAGEALEHLRASERVRRAAEISRHFLGGDAPERALPYAMLAGDQAARMCAQAEAQQHYSLALDLASELGDQRSEAEARERRADVWYMLGRFEEAYTDLAAATHRYRALGDWDRLTWATCQMAKVCDPLGRVAESMRFVEELLATLLDAVQSQQRTRNEANAALPVALSARAELASTILSAKVAARLLLCLDARFVQLGRYAEVIQLGTSAITLARRADEPRFESLAHSFRATAQRAQGQVAEAIRSLEDARRAAEASGDLEARFMVYGGLAAIHESQAQPRAARSMLLQALKALTRLDDVDRRGAMLGNLGQTAFVLGEWHEARQHWMDSLALRTLDDGPSRWIAKLALLWLDIAEGKRSLVATLASDPTLRACQQADLAVRFAALRSLTEAHILAGLAAGQRDLLREARPRTTSLPFSLGELDVLLAWVELELGNEGAAARALAQLRQEADARQNRAVYPDLWRIEALLALRQGRLDDAAQALDQALVLCQAMPHPYAEVKSLCVYGQLERARGATERAREHYQAALVICAWLGERLYAERAERALAELASVELPT